MPNTQARAVPLRGSKDPKWVITATNVSAVRSATSCGSAVRRAKYALTASTFARYTRSNSAAAPDPAVPDPAGSPLARAARRVPAVFPVTYLVAVQPPHRHARRGFTGRGRGTAVARRR